LTKENHKRPERG